MNTINLMTLKCSYTKAVPYVPTYKKCFSKISLSLRQTSRQHSYILHTYTQITSGQVWNIASHKHRRCGTLAHMWNIARLFYLSWFKCAVNSIIDRTILDVHLYETHIDCISTIFQSLAAIIYLWKL